MSSKAKKAKGKTESPSATKPAAVKPIGKLPVAMVSARHETTMVDRPGRGFSIGELNGAGLAPNLASKWGLSLDYRRRSVLQTNVDLLNSWRGQPATRTQAVEGAVREVEEDLKKAGRVAKKEAVRAEKEVVKVEKEVVSETVKAEKAVRKKVTRKPKAKSKEEET